MDEKYSIHVVFSTFIGKTKIKNYLSLISFNLTYSKFTDLENMLKYHFVQVYKASLQKFHKGWWGKGGIPNSVAVRGQNIWRGKRGILVGRDDPTVPQVQALPVKG